MGTNDIINPLRPGSIDSTLIGGMGFPFEAWEYTNPGATANPTLTLISPWQLLIDGVTEEALVTRLEDAEGSLDDLFADGQITPVEKIILLRMWSQIVVDKVNLLSMAADVGLGVGDAEYDLVISTYDILYDFFYTSPGLFNNMTITTTTSNTTLTGLVDDYSDAATALVEVISALQNDQIDLRTKYSELDTSWVSGVTATPTVPTITAEGWFKSISLKWDPQTNLQWLKGFELQISNDAATWYSLGLDGTDWKGTLNETTSVTEHDFVHTNLPLTGDGIGATYYYRIKRVTRAGLESAYSASVSSTTTGIDAGAIIVDAITNSKIADNAVGTAQIVADAVTASEIATGAITSDEILANTILAGDIAVGTITANEIAAGTITATEIATNAITAIKILASAVTTDKINALAITAAKIAATTITAAKIATTTLQALFLQVTTAITVGFTGSDIDTPVEGDRRTYIDEDEVGLEEYTDGTWNTEVNAVKVGGSDSNDIFISGVACRQIVNPQSEEISQEFFPGGRLVGFEDSFNDQNGDPPSVTAGVVVSTTDPKFGTHHVTGSDVAAVGYIRYTDTSIVNDAPCFVSVWFKPFGTHTAVIGNLELYYFVDASNEARITLCYDPTADTAYIKNVQTIVGSASTTYSSTVAISPTSYNFISIGWNAAGTEIQATVNDEKLTLATDVGLLGAAYSAEFLGRCGFSGSGTYIDELHYVTGSNVDSDLFIQHYNHNVAWNTDYSAKDLIIKPADGGRIIFDDNQDAESMGTLHMIPEADRPATWVLSGGSATSFTDVDFSSYVPIGVKALHLKYIIRWNGDGVRDSGYAWLRQNGSSVVDGEQLVRLEMYRTNYTSGLTIGQGSSSVVLCDTNGIVEYKVDTSTTSLWLNVEGYYI